jgi:ketosteroid isomerase-like protein
MSNFAIDSRCEQEIRQAVADRQRAICQKNIDRILACYAEEAVVFNVKPPFQIRDKGAWRHEWESSLAHFPASFGSETKDVKIIAQGDMAVAHYLYRFTGMPFDPSWIRNTSVYRKIEGRWLIVHEHGSVPFDPETLQAVFALGE